VVWYFGNTTIRNPHRYQAAMRTVISHGFSGRLSTKEEKEAYTRALASDGFLEPQKLARGETDNDAFTSGRKFPRALASLGFLSWDIGFAIVGEPSLRQHASTRYLVTPAGERLATAGSATEVRRLMQHAVYHYQVNNDVRRESTYGYPRFRPPRFVAQLLRTLRERGEDPVISDLEFDTIVQVSRPEPATVADQISAARQEQRRNVFRSFDADDLRDRAAERLPEYRAGYRLIGKTLRDYGDTTIRHFVISGYFEHSSSLLRPAPAAVAELEAIADEGPDLPSPGAYFATLWRGPAT